MAPTSYYMIANKMWALKRLNFKEIIMTLRSYKMRLLPEVFFCLSYFKFSDILFIVTKYK